MEGTKHGKPAGLEGFPETLRALRLERGISRTILAELCGLSKNMISRYEHGERKPSVEVLIRLAEFFGVSVDQLLGRVKE